MIVAAVWTFESDAIGQSVSWLAQPWRGLAVLRGDDRGASNVAVRHEALDARDELCMWSAIAYLVHNADAIIGRSGRCLVL
jgi:hypothetical protein